MIIKSAEELRAFYEEFARMFGANEEEKVIFAECFCVPTCAERILKVLLLFH